MGSPPVQEKEGVLAVSLAVIAHVIHIEVASHEGWQTVPPLYFSAH